MATELKPKGGAQPPTFHDADLISCINALLELERKVAFLVREVQAQARDLLAASHQHIAAHRLGIGKSDAIAKLNEMMLTHRNKAGPVGADGEAWEHGFLEAWAIAARFIYLIQPQTGQERDDGLEEAANWHDIRADRHRRHVGSQTNALRHEYYAAEIRSLKGKVVGAEEPDELRQGQKSTETGPVTSMVIRRGRDINAELTWKDDSDKAADES